MGRAALEASDARARRPGRTILAALAGVVLSASALLWPAALIGGPASFSDTEQYLSQGAHVVAILLSAVERATDLGASPEPPVADGGQGAASGADASAGAAAEERPDIGKARVIRSLPYAAFAHLSWTLLGGGMGLAFAQGLVIALALAPLVALMAARRPAAAAAALAAIALLSPLAWYVVFLTPDILGAVVVVYAFLLVLGIDRRPPLVAWSYAGLATFGICGHYGNIALALAAFGTALVARALMGTLSRRAALLATAPLAAALALNAAIGLVATGGQSASVAPLRLPLLLARSIEDGPARWHLERACPEAGYAVCEIFGDRIPDDVWTVMWSERGLSHSDRQMTDRIRAEEPLILYRAFLEYPLEQIASLGGNAARQFVRVGVDTHGREIAKRFSPLHRAVFAAGLAGLALALAARRRRTPEAVALVAVLLAALLVNALVFGGLSAPVDRYGGRLAWLAPLLAALLLLTPPRPERGAEGP